MKTMSEILHYKLMDENNLKRTEKIQMQQLSYIKLKITQLYRLKLPPYLLYTDKWMCEAEQKFWIRIIRK